MYVMRPLWSQDTSHSYTFHTSALGDYRLDYVWHALDAYASLSPSSSPLPSPLHVINFLLFYFLIKRNTQLALRLTSKGWAAEFSIPWSKIGYTPKEGNYIPFDIEVIGSNAFGMYFCFFLFLVISFYFISSSVKIPHCISPFSCSYTIDAGTSISAANWWHSRGAASSTVDIVGQATLYPYLWGRALLTTEVHSFLFLSSLLCSRPLLTLSQDMGPQQAPALPADPAFIVRGIPVTFNVPDVGLVCPPFLLPPSSLFLLFCFLPLPSSSFSKHRILLIFFVSPYQ